MKQTLPMKTTLCDNLGNYLKKICACAIFDKNQPIDRCIVCEFCRTEKLSLSYDTEELVSCDLYEAVVAFDELYTKKRFEKNYLATTDPKELYADLKDFQKTWCASHEKHYGIYRDNAACCENCPFAFRYSDDDFEWNDCILTTVMNSLFDRVKKND